MYILCVVTWRIGAGKRVGRPCFIKAFSLCFSSLPSIELYIYRDSTGVINSNCWVPDHAAVRLTPTTMITVLIQSSQSRSNSPRYPCPAERATDTSEECKMAPQLLFLFNCACVKLFIHLTKRSSRGNLPCSHFIFYFFLT